MPTTNDSRAIKINANNPAKVVEFDVGYSATFTSDLAIAFEISDKSTADADLTIREYIFNSPAGGELGRVSIRVNVCPKDVGAGISAEVTATSTTPRPGGPGQQVRSPTTEQLRRWAQDVRDSGGSAALRDVAVIDVRAAAPGGGASLEIQQNDASGYLLAVTLTSGGSAVASGAVSLTTSASAGEGFSLGPVVITDREDGGAPMRTVIRR